MKAANRIVARLLGENEPDLSKFVDAAIGSDPALWTRKVSPDLDDEFNEWSMPVDSQGFKGVAGFNITQCVWYWYVRVYVEPEEDVRGIRGPGVRISFKWPREDVLNFVAQTLFEATKPLSRAIQSQQPGFMWQLYFEHAKNILLSAFDTPQARELGIKCEER